jgi:hypothetical protein
MQKAKHDSRMYLWVFFAGVWLPLKKKEGHHLAPPHTNELYNYWQTGSDSVFLWRPCMPPFKSFSSCFYYHCWTLFADRFHFRFLSGQQLFYPLLLLICCHLETVASSFYHLFGEVRLLFWWFSLFFQFFSTFAPFVWKCILTNGYSLPLFISSQFFAVRTHLVFYSSVVLKQFYLKTFCVLGWTSNF